MLQTSLHHIKAIAHSLLHRPCRLITLWRNRHNFLILDPRDNSVTFSRTLFRHIKSLYRNDTNPPRVFVFFIPATNSYAFTINPTFNQPTQLADIQYNSKHKCIGFESLNPTVAKILYNYGFPHLNRPCRLTVTTQLSPIGQNYFQIERPPHPHH